ncbi:MAG: glucose-6-phosphate isomerase [Hyphomicrobium sp.]|nr:glucose-6-phosphate isomerase [Hyphomicrobium sp.]
MTTDTQATATPVIRQSINGFREGAIGASGIDSGTLSGYLAKADRAIQDLREAYRSRTLPLLRIAEDTADIDEAEAALERLSAGAESIVFFGTGGSGLGGQTLAQTAGWSIPFSASDAQRKRPRVRFYDNLDGQSLAELLSGTDLAATRFVLTSKSGGTTETLAQAIATISAVKSAGLESRIPGLFLGITEPSKPGTQNGLRSLCERLGIPTLDHHTGIGGRFSVLTNVGLLPAMARGVDVRAVRAGARDVVAALNAAPSPADFAPALGAAAIVALSKARSVRSVVVMPYADRLGKFADWFVQLWAESLGKSGEGTVAVPALGPVDQHSQLQLFMDGPRELAITVVRVASEGVGPKIDAELAETAGAAYMAGATIGDVVHAQSQAIVAALMKAGRPVRTLDLATLDGRSMGALLMHFMLETIIAGRLLGVDPFDQPGVELAKVLTRERLAQRG